MVELSSGGALAAWDSLCKARALHSEAQARYSVCPWSGANLRDLARAEQRLIECVDAYIAANGGSSFAPRKVGF
jgi:hypothetical protein